MLPFVHGGLTVACATVGLFFLRFFRDSHDRLFLFFGLAFLAFALNYVGLTLTQPGEESRHLVYVVRLIAFILIIVGVLDKNRRQRVG